MESPVLIIKKTALKFSNSSCSDITKKYTDIRSLALHSTENYLSVFNCGLSLFLFA